MITQPEQVLEDKLVAQLIVQGYERVEVTDEASLLANLKTQLEAFNGVVLSEVEFEKVLNHLTRSPAVFEKAKVLRDKFALKRDCGRPDGSRSPSEETVYLDFLDDSDFSRNRFQVTQQVSMEGSYKNRYDVTILVNGLPLVQVELKRRGLELKEAFNQTNRYQRHSYGAGAGLFNFIQLFVITNGVNTKYYANNRRQSFKQTFYWAEENNKSIRELEAFAAEFLQPLHLARMLGKYIVLNETDKILMVLRPYQYYATEAIVDRVQNPPAENQNGYIWHTTGSGKTLTSFKASQILTGLADVHKVVFCVDRKDLDYQTIREFNSFSKGSVDSTDNTNMLVKQFTDDTKLIVTTLQKLNTAISKDRYLKKMDGLRDEKIIFIFDECHRSQFGDTHQKIVKFFQNHQMFGFTGTPIFAENASVSKIARPAKESSPDLQMVAEDEAPYQLVSTKRTTKDLFHKKLHSYVITDAIKDENVLKFQVEYVGRYKKKSAGDSSANDVDIEVEGIDTKELMDDERRLEKITDYILAHHKAKTKNQEFTAMFCVSSIDVLIKYYQLFAKKKAVGEHQLKVATIFSYAANEDDKDADGILDEGGEIIGGDTGNKHTREHLDSFIGDYNGMFGSNYSTKDTKSFYGYYQDIAKKVKQGKVDILLVVNMFLTGFDSKKLNTLYVDKTLRYHGLIQAYSRTNRILNEVKSQGNIVVFRNLKKRTDEAIALFSNIDAKETIFIPPYDNYVEAFNQAVDELLEHCPKPAAVAELPDEEAELLFVKLFRELMRLMNILTSYAEFEQDDLKISAQRYADFRSAYLDLYQKVKSDTQKEKVSVIDDVDFELELLQTDIINVSYILKLLAQLYDADEATQKSIKRQISDTLSGDPELRSKQQLIEQFIEKNLPEIKNSAEIPDSFEDYWETQRRQAFENLVKEEQLDADKLEKVINRYVYTGKEPLPDPDLAEVMTIKPGLFDKEEKEALVLSKIKDYVTTFVKGIAA